MTANEAVQPGDEPAWRRVARVLGRLSLFSVLFVAAGRVNWSRGWLFMAVLLGSFAVNLLVVLKTNPVLLRVRSGKIRPERPFDKAFLGLSILAVLSFLVVAGLDAGRFEWSPLAWHWFYAGAALHLLGNAVVLWVMAVNPFLEPTVRIQTDRGHRVITAGPYRYVRHPTYVGGILMYSGWPLMIGSAWAFLPVAALVVLVLWRTSREDETLRQELPGYEAYCRDTRYRIVPGVW